MFLVGRDARAERGATLTQRALVVPATPPIPGHATGRPSFSTPTALTSRGRQRGAGGGANRPCLAGDVCKGRPFPSSRLFAQTDLPGLVVATVPRVGYGGEGASERRLMLVPRISTIPSRGLVSTALRLDGGAEI